MTAHGDDDYLQRLSEDEQLETHNRRSLELKVERLEKDRPSVIIPPQSPIILNPARVEVGKGYAILVGIMFLITFGFSVVHGQRDSDLRSELRGIHQELIRIRTPVTKADDSANGVLPVEDPMPPRK